MKIQLHEKKILIDEKATLIICGEIHYFRLPPERWQYTIDKLKECGANAIAFYVPWLCHEFHEGEFDFTGSTQASLNLVAFLELCAKHNLYILARPGPFIMAEMKNEGIPYWLYKKYPHLVPLSWDGTKATTCTLDYLHPDFLAASARWYTAVLKLFVPYLQQGKLLGIQLDNEVGMLSWVSNKPDLSDFLLTDFIDWLKKNNLTANYPFTLTNNQDCFKKLRSPTKDYSIKFHEDLGHYMRERFMRYFNYLKECAIKIGISGVPFFINIHGTGGGRIYGYPIGLSQLYQTYQNNPEFFPGSDIYYENATTSTISDIYLTNVYTEAVNHPDMPLASLEFNCGNNDFGDDLNGVALASATDFKTRIFIAQGNRLINYYLFAGGTNYRLAENLAEGTDRIAITGEQHGFAAPIGPSGLENPTYTRLRTVLSMLANHNQQLAQMKEERDNLVLGFIPDYFMREYEYPNDVTLKEIRANIWERVNNRGWQNFIRSLLLAGFRFSGVNIQDRPIAIAENSLLFFPSARYMASSLQQKIADFYLAGGRLLLIGEFPEYDLLGQTCTILRDTLVVQNLKTIRGDWQKKFVSLKPCGFVGERPENHSDFAQVFTRPGAEIFMSVYGEENGCGQLWEGANNSVFCALTASYKADIQFTQALMERLGVRAKLTHNCTDPSLFTMLTSSTAGKYIHLLNLNDSAKKFKLAHEGVELFNGQELLLPENAAAMLAYQLKIAEDLEVTSNQEIQSYSVTCLRFRLLDPQIYIKLKTSRRIEANIPCEIKNIGLDYEIRASDRLISQNFLEIQLI